MKPTVIHKKDVPNFDKHGKHIWVYQGYPQVKELNTCFVDCKDGHWQEFLDKKSSFTYYIIKGKGTFYLNGKAHKVKATDVVYIPPKTQIYYVGKMQMLLTVAPAWQAKNEVHIRFVEKPKRTWNSKAKSR